MSTRKRNEDGYRGFWLDRPWPIGPNCRWTDGVTNGPKKWLNLPSTNTLRDSPGCRQHALSPSSAVINITDRFNRTIDGVGE